MMANNVTVSGCSKRGAGRMITVEQLYNTLYLLVIAAHLPVTTAQCSTDNSAVVNIANNLQVSYQVVHNYNSLNVSDATGLIRWTNAGSSAITYGNWEIYYTSLRNYTLLNSPQVQVRHVNGILFKLVPTSSFVTLNPGQSLNISISYDSPTVSRTDSMPNWYVTQTNCSEPTLALVIQSTAGEDLRYVESFNRMEQWKRNAGDQYNPYTPEQRYNNAIVDQGQQSTRWQVIPTPANVSLDGNQVVDVVHDGWVIVQPPANMQLVSEVSFLAAALSLSVVQPGQAPTSKTIHLSLGSVLNPVNSDESYLLTINVARSNITIVGPSSAGVFYGIQTLISLSYPDGSVPAGTVMDWPRYQHRGHMIDVARNFHSNVSEVKKLIDAMATYKMNRLHFHLGDDEGWRLEIPELPELTEIGGRRCHDLTESQCTITQLGSAPSGTSTGSGWYSVSDYKDILSYAQQRHVKVIPEFDMPGHAHAAIVAMEARYRRTNNASFLLSDLEDTSQYLSVQQFTDNAINPCLNSTYAFIEHVMSSLIEMHRGIQNLTIYHFGGDEVALGAWTQSPACKQFSMTSAQLKAYFVERVSEIGNNLGVDLACWEDGLYSNNSLINKTRLATDVIYVNAWDNVWQWGSGERAYTLANAGYKVIISHATHFYLDFPIEADPEDRGLYWATRTIPLKRVFGYQPDSVYDNIDFDRMGNVLNKDTVCQQYGCAALQQPQNIVGIQSQTNSETARLSTQYQALVFPRLLAVAERAWHIAAWEQPQSIDNRQSVMEFDWQRFANTLSYKELRRLDTIGIAYRVPPPGARLGARNDLTARSELPGLNIRYSLDRGLTWQNWVNQSSNIRLTSRQNVTVVAVSTDGSRMSRSIEIRANSSLSMQYNMASVKLVLLCLLVGLLIIERSTVPV